MPPAIAAVAPMVGAWVAGAATAIGISAWTALTIGSIVGGAFYAYSAIYVLNSVTKSSRRSLPKTTETKGMEVSAIDSTAEARIVVGSVRTGGVHCLPAYTHGANNQYLNQVLAYAYHQSHSLTDTFIGQDVIPWHFINTGYFYKVSQGKYYTVNDDGATWIRRYTGTMTQEVDVTLNDAFPTQWPSTSRGRGVTYGAYSFGYGDGKLFRSYPQVSGIVNGALLYDPRKDSTNGGSGSHRYNDPGTWEFSTNAMLAAATHMIASYGWRCDPATEIDWPLVIAGADICDQHVPCASVPSAYGTWGGTPGTNMEIHFGGVATLYKESDGGAWNDAVWSTVGFTRGSISWRKREGAGAVLAGLHTAQEAASPAYAPKYALYSHSDTGRSYVFKDGAVIQEILVTPTIYDIYRLDYDGVAVRFYLNGLHLWTELVETPGQMLYPYGALYYDTQGGGFVINVQRRYTANGVLPISPESLKPNTAKYIDAMLGAIHFMNGKWHLYAGAWTEPTVSIDKTDWLSIDSIQTVRPRDGGRHNQVRCFYVDPLRNYQRVECYPRVNSLYRSDDAGEAIPKEMEQALCTDEYEAQRKAELVLRQSRNGISIIGTLPPRFMKVGTNDIVAVNFSELGWTSKTFRVVVADLNPNGSIKVALSEEQESDWDYLHVDEYGQPSRSVIPATNPTRPSAPQNYSITVLAGTLYHDWDRPIVAPEGTRYQVLASVNCANPTGATVIWDGDADFANIPATNVDSLTFYWTRAYVGSYQSGFYPNSFGVLAMPAPSAHVLRYPVADPNFATGIIVGSYWYCIADGGGATAGFHPPSAGQGIYNGARSAYYNAAPGSIFSLQPDRRSIPGDKNTSPGNFEVTPGQWLNWSVAYRRIGSVTGNVSSGVPLSFNISVVRYPPGDIAYFAELAAKLLRLDITVDGTWYFDVGSVQIPTSLPWTRASAAIFAAYNDIVSGQVQIGRFDITLT